MLFAMLAFAALAEEPQFEGTQQPPAEKVDASETKLSAELGGTVSTGNTDFYTLSSTINGSRKWAHNQLGLKAGLINGRGIVDADGNGTLDPSERAAGRQINAQKTYADARYDRFFGEKNSLYVLGGALGDPLSGYDLRTHEQVGYSRLVIATDDTKLRAELGADWAQEDFVAGVAPNTADVVAARILLGFSHTFNDNVAFDESLEMFENVLDPSDLRAINTLSITASLSEKLSLKASHLLTFDNQPVTGFQAMDQTSTITLVASIL